MGKRNPCVWVQDALVQYADVLKAGVLWTAQR